MSRADLQVRKRTSLIPKACVTTASSTVKTVRTESRHDLVETLSSRGEIDALQRGIVLVEEDSRANQCVEYSILYS